MAMPPPIVVQGNTIEFDKYFGEDVQLKALVQLRIHQDNIVYSRINALLIVNSMLILAFVPGVRGSSEMATGLVLALVGMLINALLASTLKRQNKVLDYNIACVNGFWSTSEQMEQLWGYTPPNPGWFESLSHARVILTIIIPRVFILLWFSAFGYILYIGGPYGGN